MRIPAAIIVLLFSTSPLLAETKATNGSLGHGTINVVLGNENGIVVLTDSRITLDGGQLSPDPAQKLFKLDDRTVCTFAGFAFAPGSGDFFYTTSSAIIQEFTRQLSLTSQPVSLEEKTHALSYIFARQLTALSNLRDAAKQTSDPLLYSVQLTVVGYDIDGSPKIVQVTLQNTASMLHASETSDDWLEEVQGPSVVTEVGKPLVARLAGIRNIADAVLANPRVLENEPAIHRYADAMRKDGGQSLTVPEMRDLAVQLAFQTHMRKPGVGGDNQVAILQKGRVISVDQAAYPPPRKLVLDFKLMVSSLYENETSGYFSSNSDFPSVIAVTGSQVLFLKSLFSGVRIDLDNNYLSGNLLSHSIVVYDGSEAMHFGNNDVRNCILVIGPHTKLDSERVKHLVHDFSWLQVVHQEPKT
jgi:20S proteasome alpha/beta subunit